MEHLSGLLRACLDSPHDPSRRLILADWLEEHGEGERAEWIRVCNRLAVDPSVEHCQSVPSHLLGHMAYGCNRCRLVNRKEALENLYPLPPLPRPADAPSLAEVLRAWCGVWPHEDDSLREFVCWWLAAVEWDHERAGKVREWWIQGDLPFDTYGFGARCPDRPIDNLHLDHAAAVRDLKRRVLGLFPEVEWTREYRCPIGQDGPAPQNAGFRFDRFMTRTIVGHKNSRNTQTIYRQTLRAPDWIRPEPGLDDLRLVSTGVTDVRGHI